MGRFFVTLVDTEMLMTCCFMFLSLFYLLGVCVYWLSSLQFCTLTESCYSPARLVPSS